ncbi:putative bifunctional diguanylate cyclase/phosphodiesterase [Reinekea sp.]|jgi:diguanylate cyclase (GGDEF)-like protein|uniref:putative bifunctional diguanylate cyclase/phosphodiesterase n=1 Tax=Reinekea sp. TaxID=1970455 RepID=UPI002A82CB1E|nr:EAL domain-containing protein [Reinekea sp.]
MNLQTKFLVNLGLLAAVVLVVFALTNRKIIDQFNADEIDSQLSTHLQLSRELVDTLLANVKSDLDLISNDSLITSYFSTNEVSRYQLFHSEGTRTLKRYLKHREFYAEIAIILPDGYKDIYVTASSMPDSEQDINLFLREKNRLNQSDETLLAVEFLAHQQVLLTGYQPVRQFSSRLAADINPIIGYIKISVDLLRLTVKSSSKRILSSLIIDGKNYYDPDTASKLQIDQSPDLPGQVNSVSKAIFERLILQSSMRNDVYLDVSTLLLQRGLLLIVLVVVSLLSTTVLLLRIVILRPLATFSHLIAESDSHVANDLSLYRYDDNEFGKLKQKFDGLMSGLRESTASLERQAFSDPLTGLPNRAALYRFLEQNTGAGFVKPLSILFLDLDGFKQINDIYGHETGDHLLIEVGKRLRQLVRGQNADEACPSRLDSRHDCVIRLGGDEFTIILTGNENAEFVAKRIVQGFQSSINIDNKALYTGVSIGISQYPAHATSPSTLIQYADLAMYQAKTQGKMRSVLFSPALVAFEKQRQRVDRTVREGIEHNRFSAHFQPKVHTRTGAIVGFEALARLRDAQGTLVPPADFVTVAQDSGVLEYITYSVAESTCQLLQQLAQPGLVGAINISPRQLNDLRLIADIRTIMWRYKVVPEQIEFEITEEELIGNALVAKQNLDLLRRFGFRTALDDFGAGYSSLGQIKKYAFDTLKLDQLFVNTEDYNSTAAYGVVTSIKSLADTLGMEIVAEGIETAEQIEFVHSVGIEIVQGYFYSQALPMAEFIDLYHQNPYALDHSESLGRSQLDPIRASKFKP